MLAAAFELLHKTTRLPEWGMKKRGSERRVAAAKSTAVRGERITGIVPVPGAAPFVKTKGRSRGAARGSGARA